MNKEAFKKMKKTAILINVARGPLVNLDDLIDALKNNVIAGYCADVIDGEGPYFFNDKQG